MKGSNSLKEPEINGILSKLYRDKLKLLQNFILF